MGENIRKIIQIAVQPYTDEDDCIQTIIYALCNDGTVWRYDYEDNWQEADFFYDVLTIKREIE